jgi:hypothetical protein
MFNNRHLTGIGKLQFMGTSQLILNEEFAGLCMMYQAIHGDEDKKRTLNPDEEAMLIENFDKIFNNG